MSTISNSLPDVRRANKGEVAKFFCVSTTTVGNWINRGCPSITSGGTGRKAWQFDLLEVALWQFEQGGVVVQSKDPEHMNPQDRRNWYAGEEMRLRAQEKQKALIPVDAAAAVVTTLMTSVRAKLLSHHNEIASLHPDLDHEIIEDIHRLNKAALEELSGGGFPEAMRDAMERVLQELDTASGSNS